MSGGDAGGDVGGESCEEELEAVLVRIGPVASGLVVTGSMLEDAPFSSFFSCSSIRTFAWVGSGSAMVVCGRFRATDGRSWVSYCTQPSGLRAKDGMYYCTSGVGGMW